MSEEEKPKRKRGRPKKKSINDVLEERESRIKKNYRREFTKIEKDWIVQNCYNLSDEKLCEGLECSIKLFQDRLDKDKELRDRYFTVKGIVDKDGNPLPERPKKGGQPKSSFPPEHLKLIERMAAFTTLDKMAYVLDVPERTLEAIKAREPLVLAAYQRGKEKTHMHVKKSLYSQIEGGSTQATIFYLKTQCQWKEAQVTEHVGADGGPIQSKQEVINVNFKDSDGD